MLNRWNSLKEAERSSNCSVNLALGQKKCLKWKQVVLIEFSLYIIVCNLFTISSLK